MILSLLVGLYRGGCEDQIRYRSDKHHMWKGLALIAMAQ